MKNLYNAKKGVYLIVFENRDYKVGFAHNGIIKRVITQSRGREVLKIEYVEVRETTCKQKTCKLERLAQSELRGKEALAIVSLRGRDTEIFSRKGYIISSLNDLNCMKKRKITRVPLEALLTK